VYSSSRPLTGRGTERLPLLQPDPDLPVPDAVAAYLRAFSVGDVDGVVAALEPDGCARVQPTGRLHRGADDLEALYARLFSTSGGIPLETCALVDDGRACALEYNVVRPGAPQLPPQAGVAVFVRGESGRLAEVRMYDDTDLAPGPGT
jgi:hypothetical protein